MCVLSFTQITSERIELQDNYCYEGRVGPKKLAQSLSLTLDLEALIHLANTGQSPWREFEFAPCRKRKIGKRNLFQVDMNEGNQVMKRFRFYLRHLKNLCRNFQVHRLNHPYSDRWVMMHLWKLGKQQGEKTNQSGIGKLLVSQVVGQLILSLSILCDAEVESMCERGWD